jgi:hypothetical protein
MVGIKTGFVITGVVVITPVGMGIITEVGTDEMYVAGTITRLECCGTVIITVSGTEVGN